MNHYVAFSGGKDSTAPAIIVQRAPEEPTCPHGRYLSDTCTACYAADEEDSGRAVGSGGRAASGHAALRRADDRAAVVGATFLAGAG